MRAQDSTTPPTVIAEIGCNHQGDLDTAFEMIDRAADFCEVDVVKFQKRSLDEIERDARYRAPHPVARNAFGATYADHRRALELSIDQHAQLKAHCERRGVLYSTSVWDADAARGILTLEPSSLKVPSACNLDRSLLEVLAAEFSGTIHLSLGMTTREEEAAIVEFLLDRDRGPELVLYACTSGYPVPFEALYLREIERLIDRWGDAVQSIGFSGHHLGIAADVAALALGATVFERHFTLDRTWKGTDHAASLEPDGLRRLGRDLRNVASALQAKPSDLPEIEREQREKLKRVTTLEPDDPNASRA